MARLAGIMAAKRTSDLIPLCHPLGLDAIEISFDFPDDSTVGIVATARVTARTGVEMEALVAVSIAALTIYDMCKGVDRALEVDAIRLDEKQGDAAARIAVTHKAIASRLTPVSEMPSIG